MGQLTEFFYYQQIYKLWISVMYMFAHIFTMNILNGIIVFFIVIFVIRKIFMNENVQKNPIENKKKIITFSIYHVTPG